MRDLSLHLLDILQNSVTAKASKIKVSIITHLEEDMLHIIIEDNGTGMDKELLERVIDPFTTTRTTRRIGLGIPLFKASAERASGGFSIDSNLGCGTTVKATFQIDNLDRPPLGDVAGTMVNFIISSPEIELQLMLENGKETFTLNSFEIKEKLGDVPITEYEVLAWIGEYIKEGIIALFGGVLNEIDSSIRGN